MKGTKVHNYYKQLVKLCKQFHLTCFMRNPAASFINNQLACQTWICQQLKLMRNDDFAKFGNATAKIISEFCDEQIRAMRHHFFYWIKHGGSELFTFGSLEVYSILHKLNPLMGNSNIGDQSKKRVSSSTLITYINFFNPFFSSPSDSFPILLIGFLHY